MKNAVSMPATVYNVVCRPADDYTADTDESLKSEAEADMADCFPDEWDNSVTSWDFQFFRSSNGSTIRCRLLAGNGLSMSDIARRLESLNPVKVQKAAEVGT